MRLAFSAAVTMARPSWMRWASGFSQYTSLPAWQARMAMIACQWSGVAITTASMSLRSRTLRKSPKVSGVPPADDWARRRCGS